MDEAIGILKPVLAALRPGGSDEGGKRIMAADNQTIKKPETLSVRDLLAGNSMVLLLFDLSDRVKATPGEYAHALRTSKQLAMF